MRARRPKQAAWGRAKMCPQSARFNRRHREFSGRRQRLVNHAMHRGKTHEALTSLFKPMTTALWHGRDHNRAATARREPNFSGRQMEAGRIAAGSGRRAGTSPQRLDPFSLPVRFETADAAADERLRVVDLHRERVVLRRSVRGMRMALNLPVAAFRGVAIRLFCCPDKIPTAIAVVLEHGDPALSL